MVDFVYTMPESINYRIPMVKKIITKISSNLRHIVHHPRKTRETVLVLNYQLTVCNIMIK